MMKDVYAFLRISVIYAIFSLIYIFILVLPLRHQTEPAFAILSKLILSAYVIILSFSLFISMAIYVAKGKAPVAAHPANVIHIARIDPVAALSALGIVVFTDLVVLVVFAFIQLINPWLPGLYMLNVMSIASIAMSWVSFFILVLNGYVFAKLYLNAEAKSGTLILPTEKGESGQVSE